MIREPLPARPGALSLAPFVTAVFMAFVLAVSAQAVPYRNRAVIEDAQVPLASAVLKPEAAGEDVQSGGGASVDISNAGEGYVMAKFSGGNGRVKLRITKTGGQTYTYDLNAGGAYEAFPLPNGDGTYKIEVFEQVSGNQYATAMACGVDVKLRDPMLPFLYPSQYVNFNRDSKAVAKAESLAQGSSGVLDTVSSVYNFVITSVSYDDNKAATVKSGYLPSVDATLSAGKGICFDYAALMTAMLRSQGIPTRLEIGYVSGGLYHAWISTYIKDVGWVNDVIQFDGKSWELMDPTFASGGNAKYVGMGQNYSAQYIY